MVHSEILIIHLSLLAIIESIEQSFTQMIVFSVLPTVQLPINRVVISLMRTLSGFLKTFFGFMWVIIWGLDDSSVAGISSIFANSASVKGAQMS